MRKGVYRLRFWADLHDGKGYARRSRTVRGTRREAEDELARVRVDHSADAPAPTVRQCFELYWLPDAEARVEAYRRDPRPGKRGERLKPHSFDQYMSRWRRHVEPAWGDVPVGDVRPTAVQEWLSTMRGQIAEKSLQVLREVLNFAVMNEHCARNAASAARYRIADGGHVDMEPWTLPELMDGVWPAVWGTPVEAAVILAAFGSCHIGEALSPMASEVALRESHGVTVATVPIVRQVGDLGEVSADGDLKNRWRVRVTALPEPWSLRLGALAEEAAARGDVWLSDDGTGSPLSQRRARVLFRRAMESAGLDPRQFRLLRVSWRSWMATSGVPAEVLEKMMGHVGEVEGVSGVTGRHYLRLAADQVADEVARAFAERPVKASWDVLHGPCASPESR